MEQRLSLITLGVNNLGAAKKFYKEGFGWDPAFEELDKAKPAREQIIFYQLNGFALSLYPYEAMKEGVPDLEPGFGSFSLSYNVKDKKEVDIFVKQAINAGAKLIREAKEEFWGGYAALIKDLDSHVWEIAWNPFSRFDDMGNTWLSEE